MNHLTYYFNTFHIHLTLRVQPITFQIIFNVSLYNNKTYSHLNIIQELKNFDH
jgi:hypothetical protein